jgi:hypothetical protein
MTRVNISPEKLTGISFSWAHWYCRWDKQGMMTRKAYLKGAPKCMDELKAEGNSRYDIKMSMAFNPCDNEVIKHADAIIKEKDLSPILSYIT